MGAFDDLVPKNESQGAFADLIPKSRSVARIAGDYGISALKGAIGVPEMAVGLADIATGGHAGKLAEEVGFRPKEAKDYLDTFVSAEQQAINKEVQDTPGFIGRIGAMAKNPSTIAHAAVESLPSMLAGGVAARGLVGAAKVAPWVAGAAGEGLVGAGSAAESTRQESADGLLTPTQVGASVASGLGTGVIGAIGGKVAQKLDIADIDTMIAGGAAQASKKGALRQVGESALSEGALEELPQSMQEQAWQNVAMDKPIGEGVPEAGAAGLLTGGLMGAVGGGFHAATAKRDEAAQAVLADPAAGPLTRAAATGALSGAVDQAAASAAAQPDAATDAATQPAAAVTDQPVPPAAPAGPLSAAAETGRAVGAMSNFQTGFGQVDELANLVQQEKFDLSARRSAAIEHQSAQNKLADDYLAAATADADARAASADQRKAAVDRAAIVHAVLQDEKVAPSGKPGKIVADLKRAGYANPTLNESEQGVVKSYLDAYTAFKFDNKVPAAPNELDAQAVGIKAAEPTKGGARPASAQTKQVDDMLTGGAKLSNRNGVKYLGEMKLSLAQKLYLKQREMAPPTPASTPEPKHKVASAKEFAAMWSGIQKSGTFDARQKRIDDQIAAERAKPVPNVGVISDLMETKADQSAMEDLQKMSRPAANDTLPAEIDAAAHEAATSPMNGLPEPTQAQKEAGNYKVGKVSLHGLDISIENPQGSTRSGVDGDGKAWKNTMQSHYGYIRKTTGADGEHVDTFIGKNPASQKVFVVDQVDPKTGKFDESKVMLGFDSIDDAQAGYQANYAKDWTGGKTVTETNVDDFKVWLKDSDTTKPFAAPAARPGLDRIRAARAAKESKPQPAPANVAPAPITKESVSVDQAPKAKQSESSTPEAPAAIGPEISRYAGQYGKGMTAFNARIEANKRNRADPTVQHTLEEAPQFGGDRYEIVGRKISAQPAPAENVVAPAAKVAAKPISSGAKVARDNLKRTDPFLSFLATEGVSQLDRADVGMDKGGNRMIPGHGPIFKKTGKRLDILAMRAVEDGHMSQADLDNPNDTGGTRKLADMIQRAVAGREIILPASGQTVDAVVQQRNESDLMQEAEKSGIETVGKSVDQVYDELSDWNDTHPDEPVADADYNDAIESVADLPDEQFEPLVELDRAAGMRAMGFTEKEITDELGRKSESTEGASRTEQVAGRDAAANPQAGSDQAGDFALEGQTAEQARAEVAAQEEAQAAAQAEEKRATEAERQANIKKEIDQRQAASADNFQLGQSAEDALAGQGDIFSQPEAKIAARDSFAVERFDAGTNGLIEEKFTRGEFVKVVSISAGVPKGTYSTGEIEGISHANKEAKVNGVWQPFGAIYKTDRPVETKPKTVAMSSVVEKVNEKHGDGLTEADRVPRQFNAMADIDSAIEGLYDGTISPEDYKAAFRGFVTNKEAIAADLNKLTKDQLYGRVGKKIYGGTETKPELVSRALDAIQDTFSLRRDYGSNSYTMGPGMYEKYKADKLAALTKLVESSTDEDLKAFSDEITKTRSARKERLDAAQDPKTVEDFDLLMRLKKSEGMTFAEARMALTPEQRAEYDILKGNKSRDERKARADQQKTEIRVAGATADGQVIETKHTKTGEPLFVVKAAERVEREVYNEWNTTAKRLGGWYSAFRGNGAVPGFQFKTRENADAFLSYLGGNTEQAKTVAQERRDAFADDRSQSAVERLTEMADRLEEKADESLGRERKANTARRARFAASAENAANAEKAMATTMRRIASAISDGTAQFLDRVRQKVQIEYLTSTLRTAQYREIEAKNLTEYQRQQAQGKPPTEETADYAEFPQYTMMRSDLANLARRMITLPNMKLIGQRILKVADDTSDIYNAFAKDHLPEVSRFGRADGSGLANFSTLKDAERSIEVSKLAAIAVPLQIKRGEYRVVLSPSEAINKGIWKGDDRKITITQDVGAEIVEKLGKLNRKMGQRRGMDAPPAAPWQFENTYNDRKRLVGMGIEQPWEFRATLREFANLKESPKERDKIKEMERAMIGRRNDGLDFFPTSAAVVEQMLSAAEIDDGMSVLEPSAGMGHIAEGIREAGVDPDVVEMAVDRRELLEAKGFNVVGSDFIDMDPRGFTYGDLFQHKDGRKGVMRGSGGLGSGRVGFEPLNAASEPDARMREWVDRDDLTGIEKRGGNSGYDRIIMNPPFSDRRDAEHVRHAYTLLRPGGRLVAIMGEGVFFGQDKKAQAFRDWLEQAGGTEEKLAEGSFMDPSLPVNTSVSARLVVIDKPETAAAFSRADAQSAGMTLEVAQAEVDRLKTPWKNAPKINVVKTANDLPFPAPSNARGAFYRGQVWLVTDNIHGIDEVQTVLFHETLRHAGLVGVFGNDMTRAMNVLALKNATLRGSASKWRQANTDIRGNRSDEAWRAISIEEALADMPVADIRGIDKFLAAIQSGLRAIGLDKVADWMERATNAEVLAVLASARQHIEQGEQAHVFGDQEAAAYARTEATDVSDPATGISTALLELGKNSDLYQLPKSEAKTVDAIAQSKGLTIEAVDKETTDPRKWMLANTLEEGQGVESWMIKFPDDKYATMTNDNGKVYINVSDVGEGGRGNRVYDLAANYAANNDLKFIGDPHGLSTSGMRRRLENMLSAAIKYGSTDFLEPHAKQLDGDKSLGIPALKWTNGNTLANMRSMVDASLAATNHTNPIATSNVHFDPQTQSFRDGENTRLNAAELSEVLGFDGRKPGIGQAGRATLQRNALFRALLSSADARRVLLESVRRQRDSGSANPSGDLKGALYSRSSYLGAVNTIRSASTLSDATRAVTSLLSSDRRFNLWDRTVGTQFNKSKKDADYKRVFDAFQQQVDDTAHYAIEAEKLAPSVLQRLGNVMDIGKAIVKGGGQHAKDMQAVSKALFARIEGQKGVKQFVYTPLELARDFGLNTKQIEMYQQVRASVDTSIDRLAQSTVMAAGEAAGVDVSRMKNMDLADTVTLVKEGLAAIREDARLRAEARANAKGEEAPEASTEPDLLLTQIDGIVEKAGMLKLRGYMPAMRFGQYAVTVKDADGEVKFFSMYESQFAANVGARQVAKQYPHDRVEKAIMNPDQFAMFKGVSPETVELFAKFSGMDQNEAFRDYIALAKSGRSSMKRMIDRQGIAGFSEDVDRVLAAFITSNARQTALNVNGSTITAALASDSLKKKGDVAQEAQKLATYMQNPMEEAQAVRGFLFMNFLGGSVASAMVNLTQPVLQTTPYLTQFAGAKTAGIMAAAAKMAVTGKIANAELRAATDRAAADGITDPHEIHNLMADASGSTLGHGLRARALTKAWGSFFSLSEAFNRRLTFIAAYQTAMQMSPDQLAATGFNKYDFAKNAIIETQGLYSKTNRPNWARGSIGATLFTFKQFGISYIEFLNRLPAKQKAIALAILVLAAGLQGLPFAEDLEDLIDTIGQSLGYNTNSKKALRENTAEMFKTLLGDQFGEVAGAILTHGLSTQTGIDMQGRLGLGNLIPGSAMFKQSEVDKGRDVAELAGPIGSVLQSFQKAVAQAQAGNLTGKTGAMAQLLPTAFKNALQGAEMAQTGVYKDTKGRKVVDVDGFDAFVKMFGFQPNEVAVESRKVRDVNQNIAMVKVVESTIADRWAQGIAEKDPEKVKAARESLRAWNASNPDSPIRVTPAQIIQRVKQLRMSREQRFVKTAPKEMRAQVMKELH